MTGRLVTSDKRQRVRTFSAVVVLALWTLPVAVLALFSVSRAYFFPQVLPDDWSLRAWRLLLETDSEVWNALSASLLIGFAVVVVSLSVSIPAGRALGLSQFRGKRIVELLLISPLLAPPMAVGMGLDFAFIRLRLSGSYWGVIVVHLIPAIPYAVLIVAAAFSNFDPGGEAQARTLGATRWAAFRYVTFPAIAPSLAVAGLLVLLVSWSQYVLTLLIGGGTVVTLPILLFSTASGGDTALTSALSVIYIAPVLGLLAVASHRVSRLPPSRLARP